MAAIALALGFSAPCHAQSATGEQARETLLKACRFFHEQIGYRGGYLWHYSGDLKLREAEGIPPPSVVWVQPPGTPAVGEAFLAAWQATGDATVLDFTKTCASALLKGQLHSGGWDHSIELDPEKRKPHGYRDVPMPKKPASVTSLDDDISQSALRFLMRLDRATGFKEPAFGDAVRHGLKCIVAAQFPNGAWYQWWRDVPKPADAGAYPVKPASYPQKWSRKWLNDWTGRYFLNDNVAINAIDTLLLAHAVYRDDAWLNAAKKAGDFLLLAQMPDPQPAWAQQYDPEMHPVWDRKFEPPAISSRESERVLLGLIRLYHATGDVRYLEPHKRAIPYLKTCLMKEAKMPRFLELQTNRPLYFEKQGKMYLLTYDASKLPKHYGFIVDSILSFVESEYQAALQGRNPARVWVKEPPDEPPPAVPEIIAALDKRGAWVQQGGLDFHEVKPASGVISCAAFVRNVAVLAEFLRERRTK